MKYNIVEIFNSIEGEGKRAGELSTFVRFAGCNLRCSYCDTTYAQKHGTGEDYSAAALLTALRAHGCNNVTLTGGEPLWQDGMAALTASLADAGFHTNIETNGSIPLAPFMSARNTFFTMDWKSPSSGHWQDMCEENLRRLREQDVLKLVIEKSDFASVAELLGSHALDCLVYLGPVFGKVQPAEIVAFMKELAKTGVDTTRMRLQLQLHKIVWPADMRGV